MTRNRKLTDLEREHIATTRALAAAIAPSLLDAKNGEVAAAPELLTALTVILDHCDGYVPNTSKAIWRDAYAAIAKATGASQ